MHFILNLGTDIEKHASLYRPLKGLYQIHVIDKTGIKKTYSYKKLNTYIFWIKYHISQACLAA